MNSKNRIQLLVLILLNYFTFALITNIAGVLFPFWQKAFNLNPTSLSLLGSVFFIAYGLTSLPQGYLHDRIGSKKTFIWGVSLLFIGSLFFALMPSYTTGLISLFVIGIGVTALQIVGNLMVKRIDENPDKYARNLNLTQIFFGVGSAAGGFLLSLLIDKLHLNWTSLYFAFAALSAILIMTAIFTPIPNSTEESAEKPSIKDYLSLVVNPLMLVYALGIFVYVGIEVGIFNWITTFLTDKKIFDVAFTPFDAAKWASFYWVFQSVGRFTSGIIMNFIKPQVTLILYALGSFLSLTFAIFAPTAVMSAVGFISVGFFLSVMFPTIFSSAVTSFGKNQEGTVAGILCTAIIGGAVTSPIIAFIAAKSSLQVGLLIASLVSFSYIAFVGIYSLLRKKSVINLEMITENEDSELA